MREIMDDISQKKLRDILDNSIGVEYVFNFRGELESYIIKEHTLRLLFNQLKDEVYALGKKDGTNNNSKN